MKTVPIYLLLSTGAVLEAEAFSRSPTRLPKIRSRLVSVNADESGESLESATIDEDQQQEPHFNKPDPIPALARKQATEDWSPVGLRRTGPKVDNLEAFSDDLTTVLRQLRSQVRDPSLPWLFRTRRPAFSNTWSDDDWQKHTSRWRYVSYIRTLPTSRLLFRILPQISLLVLWSLFAIRLSANPAQRGGWMTVAAVPLQPLSLLTTFLAALLTLRSNQGLSRLSEGREAFGLVVLFTRDTAQQLAASVYPSNPVLTLKLARHLSLFGWLLKNFLRGQKVNGNDKDIVQTLLSPEDAAYVLSQRKSPVAVVTRLRQVLRYLSQKDSISQADQLFLDRTIQKLNACITTCERIKASPIPPLYTAHTGRLLLFYLAFLPLSLAQILNGPSTVIATTMIGFTMLGLDEISHLLEQPFRLMPLWQLSKNSMKDVGDAFCCIPPALDQKEARVVVGQPYWDDEEIRTVEALFAEEDLQE